MPDRQTFRRQNILCIKKPRPLTTGALATELGFEPRQTAPEAVVLPFTIRQRIRCIFVVISRRRMRVYQIVVCIASV